ncbi:MAG: hypothetical protein WDN06_01605 [Asticcacaulis sp.]
MTAYDFLSHYWWLIFPIMGMITWTVRMVTCGNYHRERLRILKSYADRGQPIPDSLRRDLF